MLLEGSSTNAPKPPRPPRKPGGGIFDSIFSGGWSAPNVPTRRTTSQPFSLTDVFSAARQDERTDPLAQFKQRRQQSPERYGKSATHTAGLEEILGIVNEAKQPKQPKMPEAGPEQASGSMLLDALGGQTEKRERKEAAELDKYARLYVKTHPDQYPKPGDGNIFTNMVKEITGMGPRDLQANDFKRQLTTLAEIQALPEHVDNVSGENIDLDDLSDTELNSLTENYRKYGILTVSPSDDERKILDHELEKLQNREDNSEFIPDFLEKPVEYITGDNTGVYGVNTGKDARTLGGDINAVAGPPVGMILDNIARPLYGNMNALKEIYKEGQITEEDTYDPDWDWSNPLESTREQIIDRATSADAFGGNILKGIKNADPDEVWDAWKSGASLDEKTTASQIIAANAEADPTKTYHDSRYYQSTMGFFYDVAYDPLSYVGFGVVSKPVRSVSNAAVKSSAVEKALGAVGKLDPNIPEYKRLTEELRAQSDVLAATKTVREGDKVYSGEELFKMFGGDAPLPRSAEARQRRVNALQQRIQATKARVNKYEADVDFDYRMDAAVIEMQRLQAIEEFGDISFHKSLSADLQKGIDEGTVPAHFLEAMPEILSVAKVADALKVVSKGRYHTKGIPEQISHKRARIESLRASVKDQKVNQAFTDSKVAKIEDDILALQAKLDEHPSHIDDVLDDFAKDPRITRVEREELVKGSYEKLKNHPLGAKLQEDIRGAEAAVRSHEYGSQAWNTAAGRRDRLYQRRNMLQAKILIDEGNNLIAQKAGNGAYVPNRSLQELDKLRDELQSYDNVSYTGLVPEGRLEDIPQGTPDLPNLLDESGAFDRAAHAELLEPDPRFMDRASHYAHIRQAERKARDTLMKSVNPDLTKDLALADVPPVYRGPDGKPSWDLIRTDIEWTGKRFKAREELVGTENLEFLNKVTAELNFKYTAEEGRLLDQYLSRVKERNEKVGRSRKEVKKTLEKGQAVKVSEKDIITADDGLARAFAPRPKPAKSKTPGFTEGVAPYVTINGNKVWYGGSASRRSLFGSTTPADLTRSDALTGRFDEVSKALDDPNYLGLTPEDSLWKELADQGIYLPNDPVHFKSYWKAQSDFIKQAISPEFQLWHRKFKEANGGKTLEQALIAKERKLGNTVEWKGERATAGSKAWPNGITKYEFNRVIAEGDPTKLQALFTNSPFSNFEMKGGPFGTGLESYNKWSETGRNQKDWVKQYLAVAQIVDRGAFDIGMKRYWDQVLNRVKVEKQKAGDLPLPVIKGEQPKVPPNVKQDITDKASRFAETEVKEAVTNNRLSTFDWEGKITPGLSKMASESDVEEAIRLFYGQKRVDEIKAHHLASRKNPSATLRDKLRNAPEVPLHERPKRLKETLDELDIERAAVENKVKKAKEQAAKAREILDKRIGEDAVIRTLLAKQASMGNGLSLQFLGKDFFTVPGSRELIYYTQRAVQTSRLLHHSKQQWARAFRMPPPEFKSPTSKLSERRLIEVRNRAIAQTPNIIKHHLEILRHTLGDHPVPVRQAAYQSYKRKGVKGVKDEAGQYIHSEFEDLIRYFTGKGEMVGGSSVTLSEILRYLPVELQIRGLKPIRNTDDLFKAWDAQQAHLIKEHRKGKKTGSGAHGGIDTSMYSDPIRALWASRLAVEQAMARRALIYSVNTMFGVEKVAAKSPFAKQPLADKYGWKTIDGLAYRKGETGTHLFPAEVVPDIEELLKMVDNPAHATKVGNFIDEVTGAWKMVSTVYNPGYYTRNMIGEVMSSWFAGLNNPIYYKKSSTLLRYLNSDDALQVDELFSHMPQANRKPSGNLRGNQPLITLNDGRILTNEDVAVLLNDQGLRTGFINTEHSHYFSQTGEAIKSRVPGGKSASKVHQKLRRAGEKEEDWLRFAHFIYALKKHSKRNKSIEDIAFDASQEVRRYHFDYTDFTDFEKMTMMRAFPFYKWSRKALPLMISMLFHKPGKVMVYPKAMTAASDAFGGYDIQDRDTGFMPYYEGIVPDWMQQMAAYKIASDISGSEDIYGHIATPQWDTYKLLTSPTSAGYGMANPLFKVPVENRDILPGVEGSGPIAGEFAGEFDTDKQRLDQLERTTPISKFLLNDMFDEDQKLDADGKPTGELGWDGASPFNNAFNDDKSEGTTKLLSWASGMGIYENTKNRQMGQLYQDEKDGKITAEQRDAKIAELNGWSTSGKDSDHSGGEAAAVGQHDSKGKLTPEFKLIFRAVRNKQFKDSVSMATGIPIEQIPDLKYWPDDNVIYYHPDERYADPKNREEAIREDLYGADDVMNKTTYEGYYYDNWRNDPVFDKKAKVEKKARQDEANIFLQLLKSKKGYISPLTGKLTVTEQFGPRTHPVTGNPSNHTGIDLAAVEGTPIRAVADGIVNTARSGDSVYGNQVILDHSAGNATMYGHMASYTVRPGDRVKQGQIIGYVGSTGLSTGPHLHYETWYNNSPVNPMQFI